MTQDHNTKTAAPDDAGLQINDGPALEVRVLPIFCPIPAMAILPRLVLRLKIRLDRLIRWPLKMR